MAFKKEITLTNNFGDDVVFKDVYIKVGKLAGNKEQMGMSIFFYRTQDGQILQSKNYSFTPVLNESNFIAQAYKHLKTLPEFDGAVDC
jgi:hypothetical protein